jgi:hypothetical protein
MTNQEYDNKFFIGKEFDLQAGEMGESLTLYDPDDLTTHGVVVGMTGSGKTGLCIDILEEAALNGIPALMIDPKGDITNLLLHFPNLAPVDFLPWVDPDRARRDGKTVDQLAAETASLWKNGLDKWGIGSDRIERVSSAVEYTVYTPGSDAGIPISIMASLNAPGISWEENREALRERISSTATAILGLVGVESDPMRSREHILLANIFEASWSEGKDLDIAELIRQVQNPPFEKLGALEVEQFFPSDERFELAMAINSFLASPSFQAWIEGEVMDPAKLLWDPSGKPRHSIFYLAHLSDRERMFFVTLFLSAVEGWMRGQSGSPSLRAMIYFDEVLGFLPPVKEPPSKGPLMRLLKQARAFGLGLLLTTQNPVDLDYKALSNAGTWFIGRLQTEQDKARLLDGLESVARGEAGFNRSQADAAISSLRKRVFLLQNVHENEPKIFHTRWAMAYLKGPITRTQLRELNLLAGATVSMEVAPTQFEIAEQPATKTVPSTIDGSVTRPSVASGVGEYFLPNNLTVARALKEANRDPAGISTLGLVYRPAILAQASARILDRKSGLDVVHTLAALVLDPDRRGVVRWENYHHSSIPSEDTDDIPLPDAHYADLDAPLNDLKTMRQMEKDFIDYFYRNAEVKVPSNSTLNLIAQPGTTTAEFRAQCADAAREARDDEIEEVRKKYVKKMKAVQKRLAREQRELDEDQAEHSARKMEEMATHLENVIGIFGGSKSRRRVSTSMTKRRMTSKAKADIEESQEVIDDFKRELEDLEFEMNDAVEEIEDRWAEVAGEIEEAVFRAFKKDIHIDLFGVAWFPYWQVEAGEEGFELPGYQA